MKPPPYNSSDVRRMVAKAGDDLIPFPHAIDAEHNLMLNQLVRQLAMLDDLIIEYRAESEIDISRTIPTGRTRNYLKWLKAWRKAP